MAYHNCTIANVAEEAAAEELLSYKELLTSVVPGQDHKAAATSCFHVYSNWSFLLWLNSSANTILKQMPNSVAKATNRNASTTNLTVKPTNSTAKVTIIQ